MNQDEAIIRQEAKDFYRSKINNSRNNNAIDDVQEIRSRLYDFYADENKATFLDELQLLIKKNLEEHRKQAHGGQPVENCQFEKKPVQLGFYIKQELAQLPFIAHQKTVTDDPKKRTKVFVSYSHLDKAYLTDIQRHFKPFMKDIDFWDDTRILPGQKWKEEIKNAIQECKVAILLVSTDFLGSEFISTDELPPLLKAAEENGAAILMLIIKPCLFEEFPELNQFQAMNAPTSPLSRMNESDKEDLLVNLVRQTKRILNSGV